MVTIYKYSPKTHCGISSDNVMDIRNFSIQLDKKHSKRLC